MALDDTYNTRTAEAQCFAKLDEGDEVTDMHLNQHIEKVGQMEVVYADLLTRVKAVCDAGYGEDLMAWIQHGVENKEPGYQWLDAKLKTA